MRHSLRSVSAFLTVAFFIAQSPCWAAAKTLAQVKAGTFIRTTQDVNAEIPPLLAPVLTSEMELVIEGGRAVPLFLAHPPAGPVCLSVERTIELKDPAAFKLPKDSLFKVKKVEVLKAGHPPYAGPMTVLAVEAEDSVGMKLKGRFECFSNKPGKTPITIEAFEEVFGRKIRVDSN